jgi:hypothetical protein
MASVRISRPQSQATPLIAALAAAAVFELLILRTFTRTAIYIPALSVLQAPYEVVALAGRYAYFVSVALLAIVLPVLISVLARDRRTGGRVAGAGVALFLVSAGAGAAGAVPPFIMDTGTLLAFTLVLGVAAGRRGGKAFLPLAMLGGAFMAGGGSTVLQAAAQDGLLTINASWLLTVAEYSGSAFALALPLAVGRRPDRASLIAGGLVAVIAFGSFTANGGATSRILLLWNEGLTGALPGVVYAAAAGALVLAFVSLARSGQSLVAMAVALLVAGGLGLHNTYQTGLVIAGLAALCIAAAPAAPDAAAEAVVPG